MLLVPVSEERKQNPFGSAHEKGIVLQNSENFVSIIFVYNGKNEIYNFYPKDNVGIYIAGDFFMSYAYGGAADLSDPELSALQVRLGEKWARGAGKLFYAKCKFD
jgi:hypothetical protein